MFGKRQSPSLFDLLVVDDYDTGASNAPFHIYLNDRRNEFMRFSEEFTVPRISVHGLTDTQKIELTGIFCGLIPEYLSRHSIMLTPKPAAETMCIHYVRQYRGRLLDFMHILKIDLKFAGNPDMITEKGDNSNYPAFRSERLYYKSFLLPVTDTTVRQGSIQDYQPLKLQESISHEADEDGFFTYTLFDDINPEEANAVLYRSLGCLHTPFPSKIYSFFSYQHLTGCLSIPRPGAAEIAKGIDIFEPAIIRFLADNGRPLPSGWDKVFPTELTATASGVEFTPEYCDKMNTYFSRYALTVNDELLLKNWRELEIND
jgi:hypothetical protein